MPERTSESSLSGRRENHREKGISGTQNFRIPEIIERGGRLSGGAHLCALEIRRGLVPVVVEMGELDLDRLPFLSETSGPALLVIDVGGRHLGLELFQAGLERKDGGLEGGDALAQSAQLPVATVSRLGVPAFLLPPAARRLRYIGVAWLPPTRAPAVVARLAPGRSACGSL